MPKEMLLTIRTWTGKVTQKRIFRISFESQPAFHHIANTLELLSDVVFLYQLDTHINDYLSLKSATQLSATEASKKASVLQQKQTKMQDAVLEAMKQLELIGISIMYKVQGYSE